MPVLTIRFERTVRPVGAPPAGRRRIRTVAALAAVLMALAAVSSASGTTAVPSGFTALSPAFKLVTNASVAANGKVTPVVIGGSTTVPTYASQVFLTYSITTNAKLGSVTVEPQGDPSSAVTIANWEVATVINGTVNVRPGTSNKIVFVNHSAAAVKLTATIASYRSSVVGPQGPQGPQGATGPQGPQGPQGPAGTIPAAEAWHVVTFTSTPARNVYGCGSGVSCEWAHGLVEFYKDQIGLVHLRIGDLACWSARYVFQDPGSGSCSADSSGNGSPVFRLPAGYRPATDLVFPSADSIDPDAELEIGSGGSVSFGPTSYGTIGGDGSKAYEVTFRPDGG